VSEAIDWVAQRLPVWIAAGRALGLEPWNLDELEARLARSAALKGEWRSLKTQATAKGTEYRSSAAAMRSMASSQIAQIHAFARTQADPQAVLIAAGLASPTAPGPTPRMAHGFTAHALAGGAVRFGFECDHPEGVVGVAYRIVRQDDPRSPGEFLLATADRAFTDDSPPRGVATYMVTAQTVHASGNPSYVTVRFGGEEDAAIIAQWPVMEVLAA
jgi:hypothetical protein